MNTNKKVTIFFIIVILIIYSISGIYDYIHASRMETGNVLEIDKGSFIDMENPDYDLSNREISAEERKIHTYVTSLEENVFGEKMFLMIEKPDCQYLEIKFNDEIIGYFGDKSGKANLWNGTYYVKINKEILKDKNDIVITMYSDYMTGLGGGIFLISEKDYKFINYLTSSGYDFVGISIVVTFFASFILILFMLAWKNHLYNIITYRYFLISIFAIGFASLDYKAEQLLMIDYLTFKKTIIFSTHVAVLFGSLGVSSLLNTKYKFNFAMVSTSIIIYSLFTVDNMIDFRNYYYILNLVLIVAIFQIFFTVFIYRKRAVISSSVLIVGFFLCLISTTKIVLITNNLITGGVLIDIPIMIVIYVAIVLFLFYLELAQMAVDNEIYQIEDNKMGVINYMQGSFIIDKKLVVIGKYSLSCDYIFDRIILGESVLDLIPESFSNGEKEGFLKDAFCMVFDNKHKYKEGIIALLPNTMKLNDRVYLINYNVIHKNEILLQIVLTDITKERELEESIKEQKDEYNLIINSLKFKNEVLYSIDKVEKFIEKLKIEGFTSENRGELHTLKGNLGQMGFCQFEKNVHEVENFLIKGDYERDSIIKILRIGLDDTVALLKKYLDDDYFNEPYSEFNVSKEEIVELEGICAKFIENMGISHEICNKLRSLRYVDLKEMFLRYSEYIEKISQKNKKSVFPLDLKGEIIKVNPEKSEELVNSFVGIFKNSVVHGIEYPDVRVESGKDSFGYIGCEISREGNDVLIIASDDGQGIDLSRIVVKALEKGVISEEESYRISEVEKLELIFRSNFSGLDCADLYGGRGIGLNGVNNIIKKFNGNIEIENNVGLGTKFIVRIPFDSLID